MAQMVLPEPVAICTSARGRPRRIERSTFFTASTCTGYRKSCSSGGSARRRARSDAGRSSPAAVKCPPALGVQALYPRVEGLGREPLGQRFRSVDVRDVGDAAGLGLGVEAVDEPGLDPGADVEERQRADRRMQRCRQAGRVLVGLQLDAGQRVADRLRFENAGCPGRRRTACSRRTRGPAPS